MFRGLIFILFLSVSLFSQKIEINAKIFEGSKNNRIGIFTGDVLVKRDNDFLNSESLEVRMNDKNKIISYIAKNVEKFSISMNGKTFKGRAGKIIYDVSKNIYELSDDIKIYEDNKELIADHIILDKNSGIYKFKSNKDKTPVKIIFEMSE